MENEKFVRINQIIAKKIRLITKNSKPNKEVHCQVSLLKLNAYLRGGAVPLKDLYQIMLFYQIEEEQLQTWNLKLSKMIYNLKSDCVSNK